MASRIMHLAATVQLLPELPQGMSVPRFLSGVIMVDSAPQARRSSHYHLTQDDGRRTYDIARFRDEYGHMLLTDGLVLGYYVHLLQDLVFRDYVYHTLGLNPRIPGYLQGIHSDYRRLNRLLIRRYGLKADFDIPPSAVPLQQIADFDMAGLPAALAVDFMQEGAADAFFFTEEHAHCYIEKAVLICKSEIKSLRAGMPLTDPMDWTWRQDPV